MTGTGLNRRPAGSGPKVGANEAEAEVAGVTGVAPTFTCPRASRDGASTSLGEVSAGSLALVQGLVPGLSGLCE
jgi:hypothetical protein